LERDDQSEDVSFRDVLAHVMLVASKPIPYMVAGVVGGVTVEVVGNPTGSAFGIFGMMAILCGMALVVAPPYVMLRDCAENHRKKSQWVTTNWLLVWGIGALVAVPLMVVPLLLLGESQAMTPTTPQHPN